jgi:hypothetical protein
MSYIKKYFDRIALAESGESAVARISECKNKSSERWRSNMKRLTAAAAFNALVALPAGAGQPYRQIASVASPCNNGAECAALNGSVSIQESPGRRIRARNIVVRTPDTNSRAPGVVVSSKTGARARVGVAYVARFQAYIDDLENNYGARVLFMGGLRPGRCSIGSQHPCGKALDVCQHRRGVVDPGCHLPGRAELGKIAASHGLFEGGRWCNSDYGHAQVDESPGGCGTPRTRFVRR